MQNLLQPLMLDYRIWIPTKPYAFSRRSDGEKMVRSERSVLFPGYILIDGESYDAFCMKADVASSETANNVELVRLYCKACPYDTPAQTS